MDSQSLSVATQLDAQIGTTTRPPRLGLDSDFYDWKFRFKQYVKFVDGRMWRSIVQGPREITQPDEDGVLKVKEQKDYSDDDWTKVEPDDKALAALTMALTPEVATGYKQYTTAKSLWDALVESYEGNDEMKEVRKDTLRHKFNMFHHVLNESLENQIQRFVHLTTEMKSAGLDLNQYEVNKKLLYSLPRSWDTNISIIKGAHKVERLSLNELISTIRSYELVNKQRDLSHATTMNTAGVQSSNTAFASGISHSSSQGINLQGPNL